MLTQTICQKAPNGCLAELGAGVVGVEDVCLLQMRRMQRRRWSESLVGRLTAISLDGLVSIPGRVARSTSSTTGCLCLAYGICASLSRFAPLSGEGGELAMRLPRDEHVGLLWPRPTLRPCSASDATIELREASHVQVSTASMDA